MNVHCESCETVYRIDPLKVPEAGVRARCTICSNVITVTRSTEDDSPAVSRVRAERVSSQTDRVAHQLGDAFIPAPQDDDEASTFSATEISVPERDEMDTGFEVEDSAPDTRTDEEIAASRRKSVESLPGIIMPPEEDDIPDREQVAPPQPFSAPPPPPPPVDLPPAAVAPPEVEEAPRVSRPFSLPRDIASERPLESPAPPPVPVRPTAPVFRPTPGRPVQAPTTAPPPRPSVDQPVAAPTRPRSPTRPINPFLSRDPGQKARRLARALISDMIVYQPDKRQRALQDGNLAEAFEEEIKKSWEEYVEQVGEELANSTSYFKDALNDLLADGDQVF